MFGMKGDGGRGEESRGEYTNIGYVLWSIL
jgi:hypothetical protein